MLSIILNLGLKSIRAVMFDEDQNIVAVRSLPLSTYIDGVYVEQDPEEWWEKGSKVIRDVISSTSTENSIRYLTVTASSCCLVLADKDGMPLANAVMVSDKRADKEARTVDRSDVYKALYSSGGCIRNSSSLMIPKIIWVKNHRAELYEATGYFLSPNDYFYLRLTGSAVTDQLNAEKCGYNITTQQYQAGLFEEFGIPTSKLPFVSESPAFVGEVKEVVANELKLKGCACVLSTYDAICAFIGSGPVTVGDACDVSGTVTSLRALTGSKLSSPNSSEGLVAQYVSAFDVDLLGGSNNLGGGLIEWAKQALYSDCDSPYGVMQDEAASLREANDGLVFLPYLMGERAPIWDDKARGVFFGLARHHRREHLIRSVFESAGYALKALSDEVSKFETLNSIRVSGGLARINLINQIKADILGKKVIVLDEFETTAIGANSFIEKYKNKLFDLRDISEKTTVRQVIYPKKSRADAYAANYELFKNVYLALKPQFHELNNHRAAKKYTTKSTIENM